MTREEIQSKLQAIKNNNALPEKQKGMLIDKYEKMLGDLTPAALPKPKAEKKTTEPKLKAQKDPATGETFYPVSYEYFDRVWKSKKNPYKEIALTIGWDVFSYDEFKDLGNGDFEKGLREYLKKIPGASLDFQPDQDGTIYRIVFKDLKTTSKKPAKTTAETDYDCDDLIEEAKERKAKALAAYEKRKNAPKKSAATKSKDAVIRAEKSVEKGVKKGDISVSEIEKIIAEYEDAIKKLKALLETAKNKMGNGGSVDPEEVEHILMKAQGIKDHHCKCHDKMGRGGYIVKYGPKNDVESDVLYQASIGSKKEVDSFVEVLKANGHKNISVVPKNQSKMAAGGRLKDSDIQVGNKYELMNGETIEIKRLFVENGDENWVAFTRSSVPDQMFENSLSGLKNFINNWRNKMATGGAIEMNSWVQERKGNARGQVYHKDGEFVKLKDKYGNESNTLFHTRDLKMSSRPRYEQGGVVGQEITFDFQGEEKQGVISQITDRGDYIVMTPDGRTLLAERDMDVIALGGMHKSPPMQKKRFGFFETGGSMYDQDM
jgi:hypothetical protein